MSVFQLFWNLILGISGGIISGIIVSRIFLIQGDFQNQINSFDLLLRKLGYTSGMLLGIRTVQEFSYDSDIKMHNEMKKEGISTEEEYYKAHIDVNWISKDRLVSDLLKECKKMNTSLFQDLWLLFKLFFWFTFSCYFIVIVFQNRIILIRFCILLMWLQSCCTQIVPRIAYKPKLVFTLLNNTPAFIRFL